MSFCRAPVAMRTPISRVRSVTETSMMFMTPIPPTSSEIAADRARAAAELVLRGRDGLEQLGAVDDPEVLDAAVQRGHEAAQISCVSLMRDVVHGDHDLARELLAEQPQGRRS